jgi:hypothetical protein
MPTVAKKPRRAGQTDKISVSIERSDLSALRRRAQRLYGGNLSAVIAEGVRRVREEEGREALAKWLGDAGSATPAERAAVRAEWKGEGAPAKRRRKAG